LLEKVSLLKNSNALGNDVYPDDIFLYNLNKKNNELNNDNLDLLDVFIKIILMDMVRLKHGYLIHLYSLILLIVIILNYLLIYQDLIYV
jgi:hypothetical protein